MNEPDVDITELTSLDVEKLSAVSDPANGTPFLLLKSTPKENTVKKKSAKKLREQQRQEQVRKSAADFVKAYATDRVLRRNVLERAVKAMPSDPGFGYMHARELLKQGREDDMRAARGLPPLDQASAIQAAAAPSIGRALGASVNGGPHDPRGSLVSVFRDSYTRNSPQDLPGGDPTLPSLRENHQADTEIRDLEKQLKKGRLTKEEREIIGFRLTRARLIQGHRQGVI